MRVYEVHRKRAVRMRARVMKAFLRMARGVVAEAAQAASVKFYEAAGVKIRGQSPISPSRT
jgi:hypothetical protein